MPENILMVLSLVSMIYMAVKNQYVNILHVYNNLAVITNIRLKGLRSELKKDEVMFQPPQKIVMYI